MAPKIAEGMAAGRKSHRKKESSGGGITGKIISKILKRGPKGSSKTSQHNLTRKPHLPFASHISSSLRAGPAGTSTESASAGNDDADWLQYKRKNSSRRCIGGLSSSNAGVFCYINTSIQVCLYSILRNIVVRWWSASLIQLIARGFCRLWLLQDFLNGLIHISLTPAPIMLSVA